jgi:hypothetical protein
VEASGFFGAARTKPYLSTITRCPSEDTVTDSAHAQAERQHDSVSGVLGAADTKPSGVQCQGVGGWGQTLTNSAHATRPCHTMSKEHATCIDAGPCHEQTPAKRPRCSCKCPALVSPEPCICPSNSRVGFNLCLILNKPCKTAKCFGISPRFAG